MQVATFKYLGHEQVGVVTDHRARIIPLNQLLGSDAPATMMELIERWEDLGPRVRARQSTSDAGLLLTDVQLVAPLPQSEAQHHLVWAKNYTRSREGRQPRLGGQVSGVPTAPVYFSKMVDYVRGSTEAIPAHADVTRMLDYEAELAVIIGKEGHDIDPGSVSEHIFGYSVLNDVTARDLQQRHEQWFKGKSLDGGCAMGPVVVTADEITYPPVLSIECRVNGELRQKASTSQLIFDIAEIISDFSKGLTLKPGDIISTGTPAGVGMGFHPPKWLKSGDIVECSIERIGTLTNRVK